LPAASLLISLAAIAISLLALWKTHLAPFSALAIAGQLRIRIYPIKSGERRWFIPSLDVPVSVTNQGARPGAISGLRLRLHFPGIPIPGNCEYIKVTFEIAPQDAKSISKNRFEWTEKIVPSDWMPFAIVPKATVTKHLIFESRWETPVVQDIVDCTLEIRSDPSRWQNVTSWRLSLGADIWSGLVDGGVSIAFLPEGIESVLSDCIPPDLHKYTGTKDKIPKSGFGEHESYLDYPGDDPEGSR
jgi:hypothetical protein